MTSKQLARSDMDLHYYSDPLRKKLATSLVTPGDTLVAMNLF